MKKETYNESQRRALSLAREAARVTIQKHPEIKAGEQVIIGQKGDEKIIYVPGRDIALSNKTKQNVIEKVSEAVSGQASRNAKSKPQVVVTHIPAYLPDRKAPRRSLMGNFCKGIKKALR